MLDVSAGEIRAAVLVRYRQAADSGKALASNCCCGGGCGPAKASPGEIGSVLGYSPEDLAAAPEGANLGLGCGNPQAIAALQSGETVLDLGCGGGFDCFLAAKAVGPEGRVIGVDMTAEMIGRARDNARRVGVENAEFRLGEIEHLPLPNASVDVIISNCVINLAADKEAVYREAFRVLRPGGRLAISDVVALRTLPDEMQRDLSLWASCGAGALLVGDLIHLLKDMGFVEVSVLPDPASPRLIDEWVPGRGLGGYLASGSIRAVRPDGEAA